MRKPAVWFVSPSVLFLLSACAAAPSTAKGAGRVATGGDGGPNEFPDIGILADSGPTPDTGLVEVDAGPRVDPDSGPLGEVDAGSSPDAGPAAEPDAGPVAEPDAGPPPALDAGPRCDLPVAPTVVACDTSWDRRPILEFDAVPVGITYEVWMSGDSAPLASVSAVGQNYYRPTSPIGSGAVTPGMAVELFVRACDARLAGCCTDSEAVQVRLVSACTTPVPATANNIVFSEYVTDGDGLCPGPGCEAGEAIEVTNLSECPVSLEGLHFAYCNGTCSTFRWMNFGASDVVPPRGVYVAIRNAEDSMCEYPFFGAESEQLFGLRVSRLEMQGEGLQSGWFNNSGGAMSQLQISTGPFESMSDGDVYAAVGPYIASARACESVGFDALDACGNVTAESLPTERLTPNQLGRLWHPCDAVESPSPADCR